MKKKTQNHKKNGFITGGATGFYEYYPEFHRLFRGWIVEVCEGEGTSEDACRNVYYVHDEEGKLLGRLDSRGLTSI